MEITLDYANSNKWLKKLNIQSFVNSYLIMKSTSIVDNNEKKKASVNR